MTARNSRRVGRRPLKRRVGRLKPRKTLLVFCEGEKTEPEYLNALKRLPSVRGMAAVDLRVENRQGGSVPRTLVSLAITARNRAIDEEGEIDELWCVFDVEWPRNHPGLKEAIDQARQNGIEVAASNPCFELWLILHCQDQTAWLNTSDAEALRRSLDGASGKGVDPAIYMPLIDDAARRAVALDNRHMRNGTIFPHNNPSSGMHRLLTSVKPTD